MEQLSTTWFSRSAGKISGRGSLVDQAKREFLRQYTNKEEGYKGTGYRELANWLTSHGYETSVDAIKNAKRSRVDLDWLGLMMKMLMIL